MHEIIAEGNACNHKSVKPVAIPSVELITKLIEIVLHERVLHIMENIQYFPLGIADYNVNPRQHPAHFPGRDDL